MASKLPVNYRKSQEAQVTNYDFLDVFTGVGYKLMYAGTYGEAGAEASGSYLSSNIFYSDQVDTVTAAGPTSGQAINT